MSAGLLLGEQLAAVVVAVMYAGGNALEDFAMARAERDLKSLVDRAPRTAHRLASGLIEEISLDCVSIGDAILVLAGEIVPVDGVVFGSKAVLDEFALTGEPMPVERGSGEVVRSGTLNAGEALGSPQRRPPEKVLTPVSYAWSRKRKAQRRRSSGSPIATRCCCCH